MKSARGVYVLIAAALAASAASAQVSGPADPGRVEERFERPQTPESTPPIIIPAPEAAFSAAQAAQTRFILTGVLVEGATVYPAGEFEALYRGMLGREVSLLDVQELRDAISAKYRADGYLLSQAIIPPQELSDGIVRITVIEGYIADVKVEGDVPDSRNLIRRMAEKIGRSRPARLADLERYVLLIDDLPGLEASTVLRPSPDMPGAADLIVVVRRTAFGGFAAADNRGSVAIGPGQLSAGLEANSLLGLNEQTFVQIAMAEQTEELKYLLVRHDEVLNTEGLRLSASGSASRTRSGGALAALDPLGKSEVYRLRLSQPLIRSRSRTLTVTAGLNYLNSTTELLGAPFSEDRVRFLALEASYDFADTLLGTERPASTVLAVQAGRGLDILDATESGSPGLSRANGRSDFTKISVEATRVQSVAPRISLALSFAGQLSADPLLSSQQFGLGGARYGRGYEPSEITGDHGAAVTVEARYGLPLQLPNSNAQFYAYYDAGKVWAKAPLPGEPDDRALTSAGIGLRLSLARRITAELELAKPLTRDIASRGDREVRPLFSLSTTF